MSTPQVVLVLVLGWIRHHASHRFALIVKTELSADYMARQIRNHKNHGKNLTQRRKGAKKRKRFGLIRKER